MRRSRSTTASASPTANQPRNAGSQRFEPSTRGATSPSQHQDARPAPASTRSTALGFQPRRADQRCRGHRSRGRAR
ncbi:hypothetical protein ASF37_13920 [Aeromicrobium sp. Leaf289]|nr:hypothetical protein ASF05_06930 [Aeromicrobium sp. Leaf245]KQP26363.1 hypothetical protein ASF38_12185 [Aeromicrobium sp. Leaf272]KQP76033.1 hypothetical protein ASF37_13920 [Aeromicrobium sp. Leaf289]KQP85060.1 hypothetical protein ASF35_09600 [Aeromicrobium sp. Leaf291]